MKKTTNSESLQKILDLLEVKESFEIPDKLLNAITGERKNEVLDALNDVDFAGNGDAARDMFQIGLADRDRFKQDYTPHCLCKLMGELAGTVSRDGAVLDICGGTGALALGLHDAGVGSRYVVEEISSAAIPWLLANLAIRNMNAEVRQKDIITGSTKAAWSVSKGEKYSDITAINNAEDRESYSIIVANPPFSMPWEQKRDSRFDGFELPPKKASDYVFILDALSRLKDGGSAFVIIPHGILFRGNSEGKIREELVKRNLINAVIGLPANMFMNTGIPVCIVELKKSKPDSDILFINADKLFEKAGKVNVMKDEHIERIVSAYKARADVPKLAALASREALEDNDYNMNIQRYADTNEPPPPIDIEVVTKELIELDGEIRKTSLELANMLDDLVASDEKDERGLKLFAKYLRSWRYGHEPEKLAER